MANSAIRVPKDAPTAWKRTDGKGDYYSVGSLWLMLKMRDDRPAEYTREGQKLGIPIFAYKDKKSATAYFTGQVNESDQIDTAKRAQTLIRKSSDAANPTSTSG